MAMCIINVPLHLFDRTFLGLSIDDSCVILFEQSSNVDDQELPFSPNGERDSFGT